MGMMKPLGACCPPALCTLLSVFGACFLPAGRSLASRDRLHYVRNVKLSDFRASSSTIFSTWHCAQCMLARDGGNLTTHGQKGLADARAAASSPGREARAAALLPCWGCCLEGADGGRPAVVPCSGRHAAPPVELCCAACPALLCSSPALGSVGLAPAGGRSDGTAHKSWPPGAPPCCLLARCCCATCFGCCRTPRGGCAGGGGISLLPRRAELAADAAADADCGADGFAEGLGRGA